MPIDKKILSIDADDDDGVDIRSFTKFVQQNTDRTKNSTANQFNELGEDLLAEIEEKKTRKEFQKQKLISYVLKHNKGIYSERLLKAYSYEDVKDIYDELKNKNVLRRVFHFVFNLSNH
jgi:putative lipase involved disintegration of autophagic bodies